MVPTPKAVRVKTSDGWQDIAIVGPPGPVGPSGYYAALQLTNPSLLKFTVTGSWGVVPLNLGYTELLEPAGAFTRNADGSVSVRDAGWYHVSANARTDAASADCLLYLSLSTGGPGDGNIGNGLGTGAYARATVAGDIKLTAGQKVWMYAAGVGGAVSPNNLLGTFSIHRIGAGPAGVPTPDSTKVQVTKGSFNGVSANFTSAAEAYSAVGGDMRHTIVPSTNLWWEVTAHVLLNQIDQAWARCDCLIDLNVGATTSDADGSSEGRRIGVISHGAVGWNTANFNALFKLEKGKSYTARPVLVPQGYTWQHHRYIWWLGVESRVVGYW